MFTRILRAIFCGSSYPVTRRSDISCEGGEVIEDGHVYGVIDELAKADPDIIEEYCEGVVRGIKSYNDLSKALPIITSTVCRMEYNCSDRNRIRNALKTIVFHCSENLERTAKNNLLDAIGRMSNA